MSQKLESKQQIVQKCKPCGLAIIENEAELVKHFLGKHVETFTVARVSNQAAGTESAVQQPATQVKEKRNYRQRRGKSQSENSDLENNKAAENSGTNEQIVVSA